jgi:acetate kinase
MGTVAPAHNPPYVAAMRLLTERLPGIPLVAAFETGFHATISDANRHYAAPYEWSEQFHIKRWGFHGASHRYIATRSAELFGPGKRVISLHLGGSNSLCAIRAGQSVATTMGMSPQSGLAQNNRVGDFDPFALPLVMERTGKSLAQVLDDLAERSGLLGLSGLSGDVRDLEDAAAGGNRRARLALDVFVAGIRYHLGGMLVELGGADAIIFTGGIGENGINIRAAVCRDVAELGIEVDAAANAAAKGEAKINSDRSRAQVWVMPTNEEIIVARQTKELLSNQ